MFDYQAIVAAMATDQGDAQKQSLAEASKDVHKVVATCQGGPQKQTPAEASEDDHKVVGAPSDTEKKSEELPMPTLTQQEYEQGCLVKCFIPGCHHPGFKDCYGSLSHISKAHKEYSKTPTAWKNTFWYETANAERTAVQKKRRDNPNPKKRATRRVAASAPAIPAIQSGSEAASDGSALVNIGQAAESAATAALALPAQHSGSESASSGSALVVGGQTVQIPRPGKRGTILSSMYVPRSTYDTLVQIGFLFVDAGGNKFWNPDTQLAQQNEVLFQALPYDSLQREHFGKALSLRDVTPQAQPLVSLVPPAIPSTIVTSASGMNPDVQSLIVEMRNVAELVTKLVEGPPTVALQKIKIKEEINQFSSNPLIYIAYWIQLPSRAT